MTLHQVSHITSPELMIRLRRLDTQLIFKVLYKKYISVKFLVNFAYDAKSHGAYHQTPHGATTPRYAGTANPRGPIQVSHTRENHSTFAVVISWSITHSSPYVFKRGLSLQSLHVFHYSPPPPPPTFEERKIGGLLHGRDYCSKKFESGQSLWEMFGSGLPLRI